MEGAKNEVRCAPGETLCLLVNTDTPKKARASWDGNGGVSLRGKGADGRPWTAEFHHVVGEMFEIVSVQGSLDHTFHSLSPSSRGMKITAQAILREIHGD